MALLLVVFNDNGHDDATLQPIETPPVEGPTSTPGRPTPGVWVSRVLVP